MIFVIIFLAELSSLFYFSKLLTTSLAQLFYFLTKSHRATVSLLAAIYLPGTVIHELSHVITAGVLMVHTGEMEFTPQIREDGVKLGSAEIGKTDPIRRALIGVAPVILGSAAIIALLVYFHNLITTHQVSLWAYPVVFYLLFELSNTMFSSPKDLEGTLGVLVIIISFFIAIYLLGFQQVFQTINTLFTRFLLEPTKLAALLMLIPIGVDIIVYLLVSFLTNRKIRTS